MVCLTEGASSDGAAGRRRRLTAPSMTETQWLRRVRYLAKQRGWFLMHLWTNKFSPAGFPDLLLLKSPRIVFAELKRVKGRLRPAQVEWLGRLQKCGVEAYLWRPQDENFVIIVLEGAFSGTFGDGI